jgi:hypothetical protein
LKLENLKVFLSDSSKITPTSTTNDCHTNQSKSMNSSKEIAEQEGLENSHRPGPTLRVKESTRPERSHTAQVKPGDALRKNRSLTGD